MGATVAAEVHEHLARPNSPGSTTGCGVVAGLVPDAEICPNPRSARPPRELGLPESWDGVVEPHGAGDGRRRLRRRRDRGNLVNPQVSPSDEDLTVKNRTCRISAEVRRKCLPKWAYNGP